MGRYDALYHSLPSPALPAATPARDGEADPQPMQQHALTPHPPTRPPVRSHRSNEPNDRTDTAEASLLDEIAEGTPDHRRPTERYSFEIYTDQKPRIEELQYRFKQRTGQKLSSSRIIREAIEAYLPEVLRLLADRPHTRRVPSRSNGDTER